MSVPGWMNSAACRGDTEDLFYSREHERGEEKQRRERRALDICFGCPVRQTCLEYAIAGNDRNGIWGGLTEDERTSERRRRMRKVREAA